MHLPLHLTPVLATWGKRGDSTVRKQGQALAAYSASPTTEGKAGMGWRWVRGSLHLQIQLKGFVVTLDQTHHLPMGGPSVPESDETASGLARHSIQGQGKNKPWRINLKTVGDHNKVDFWSNWACSTQQLNFVVCFPLQLDTIDQPKFTDSGLWLYWFDAWQIHDFHLLQ